MRATGKLITAFILSLTLSANAGIPEKDKEAIKLLTGMDDVSCQSNGKRGHAIKLNCQGYKWVKRTGFNVCAKKMYHLKILKFLSRNGSTFRIAEKKKLGNLTYYKCPKHFKDM